MKIILKGKKIILRKVVLSDAASLTENINDKELARWTTNVPYPYKINDAIKFIRSRQYGFINRKCFTFGIVPINEDTVIGGVDLVNLDYEDKKAELGYWIGERYRGNGFATEAVNLMTGFGFRELKLHKIYARVFDKNYASMKVLENNGFRHEGCLRDEAYKNKRWVHEHHFGLLKSEYNKHK